MCPIYLMRDDNRLGLSYVHQIDENELRNTIDSTGIREDVAMEYFIEYQKIKIDVVNSLCGNPLPELVNGFARDIVLPEEIANKGNEMDYVAQIFDEIQPFGKYIRMRSVIDQYNLPAETLTKITDKEKYKENIRSILEERKNR
ncbi:MAG: hypothetical protein JW789_00420 [Candidatus Aenigmarchaeota archaeon]|nr:hypothetical protein [Candidatus Aenigmarchaeota archaeon]